VLDEEDATWESLVRGDTVDEERVSLRKDGSEFQEEVSFAPVLDGDGAIQNVIVVRQDVTERRRLDQMRSDLMDAVSHELRSPLTNIIGYTDLVLGLESPDLERMRHFAGKIRTHAEHMNRLVEELLQISRLQHGTRPTEIERVDLARLLRHQVDSITLPDGHDLRLEVPDGEVDLACEPTWISTAVGNLIDNAIKYSPDGGTVSIALEEGDGWVTVSVSDEGIGIEEGDAEQIFERFTQADMSTTRSFGGFGLGLAIVKDVAAAHGGDIEVDSVPGEGSRFTIRLPRRPIEDTPD
jgi:signal transduction histidine kinase